MNLFDYFKDNVNIDKIKNIDEDIRELAIVRYVMKEASKMFYRDYTFFLDKENIKDRESIYNKEIDLTNIQDFAIVCKSYSNIIKNLLKHVYNIDSELVSPFEDKFRHVDLLIKTKNGKKYIVDPLTDLIEMQVGIRTNNFASEEYYNSNYSNILDNISFLNENTLEEIDNKIGYKIDGIYLDDFFKLLKTKLDNIDELLQTNDSVAFELLGQKYDRKKFSEKERTGLKLKFISKHLNNRQHLNGVVDLVMFSNMVIKELFTDIEQEQIHIYSFFVDNKDLKDENLKNVLINKENRKRGVVINFDDNNYIFSLNPTVLEYDKDTWKNIVEENNIFIKPQYSVKLLKYLKNNGADRNIVHNNEFLKLFNKFEKNLLNNGYSLEDIINNNIFIQNGVIYTKSGNDSISYKIENGNLVFKEYNKNLKHTVLYQDEGRNISYITEPILKENEKLYLYEFDSNGLFDLDDVTGIEELVSPLSNGKYLSRNFSFYEAKTYSELADDRKRLNELLTEDLSKKNFVILEYLANSSAKIYFEELKKKIENQDNQVIEAQKCFEEDCANIVRFFRNQPLQKAIYNLPNGNSKILERHIEMDNKQILYMFCSNLKFNNLVHIITPGLGSIFVGPMLKSMYGYEYTNILFSLYSKDEKLRNISTQKNFDDIFSNDLWKDTSNQLVLIDDNVGSCNTMNTIRDKLKERGKTCRFGAIKYNWDFYNQVKHGELDHPTFDVSNVDFLTILDDPGYWIMRDSIVALKENDGDTYVSIMKKEGLRQTGHPDIEILMKLAEKYSHCSGIDLYDMESRDIKKTSAFLCNKLREQIKKIIRDIPSQDRGRDE